MALYNYSFLDGEKTVCGSRNIHIDDNNLGIIRLQAGLLASQLVDLKQFSI